MYRMIPMLVLLSACDWEVDTDAAPQGQTMSEWSAQWWQWVMENPVSDAAIFDETGASCANYQDTDGPVFFLAGTFGGSAERTCTIPLGQAVLIPVINLTIDNGGVPEDAWTPDADLEAAAAAFQATVSGLTLTVDGEDVDAADITAVDPYAFAYTVPDTDNIYQLFGNDWAGTADPSYSTGHYVMMEPPAPGEHELAWSASAGSGDGAYSVSIAYHLTVE
ncbi:MAG: hypothetical protein Q8P41_17325 [Pseudomonadota bacterium]|nr:hypothetical protein [Pseudomonadota bacterium]